jgi:hypothetical protein
MIDTAPAFAIGDHVYVLPHGPGLQTRMHAHLVLRVTSTHVITHGRDGALVRLDRYGLEEDGFVQCDNTVWLSERGAAEYLAEHSA